MDHFETVWNALAPILFIIIFFLEIIFTMRISQRISIKIMVKLSNQFTSLYKGNGIPLAKPEQGGSSFLRYMSLFVGSFVGIIITGFLIGGFMLFAVSEFFNMINLSLFPSFFNSIFEWIVLVASAVMLFFMGLYASRLISYYLHKLPLTYAHTYAQIASLGLLAFFIFMSFSKFGSAVQFINLSFLIVSISVFISLMLPVFQTKVNASNFKSLLHRNI